ncbi:Inner membrane protein YmfA [Tsuneonella dongtanensis]|uniref:Inner membrane protein YmfA n=1 Tax=Tsuneonella dongtanensis TaxID=692370 RepID=A0A1B2A9B3_9SPHN|nr:DUF3592 domain-containing protein [Tsuneonella dongtanensis]ANY18750.1 Inner membrane protein YmfA [Tsuneonella dongtanensis]
MRDRFFLWFGSAFAAFGLLFAGVGGWMLFDDLDFQKDALHARGTVVDLEQRTSDDGYVYAPIVEWRDQNGTPQRFVGGVGSNPAAYDRGEAVDVTYHRGLPGQARVDSFTERHMGPAIFGGMGSLFAIVGLTLVVLHLRRRRTIASLKSAGMPIQAKFLSCQIDRSTTINGRHPYRVSAQATHPTTGKLHRFDSDYIWVDLSDSLNGKPVRVLCDPTDPEDYFVDLSDYVEED